MRTYFLQTERLGFSRWTEEDGKLAASLWGDPEVTIHISATGVFTELQVQERLRKEIRQEQLYDVQYWPLFELETGEFVGCCGLQPYQLDKGIYELGFHLKRTQWGKGYAGEAAEATIAYAFNEIKAVDLFAGHNPENKDSKKLLQKLGFTYTHDEYYPPTGLQHPSYLYHNHTSQG
ncbi:GNAT family N-acetyltransferase [Paenibacillus sp. SC116]|uniref:GNAT family N-acetyltransferase n=1 Tax=Paenibacillus sp. SC116 TaxID=2968986 RepID=UPI00215B140E|nr:GNAT family N-acetyltransferase [Paenibacillus sp. SC116]MCR8842686.1 GNAT family N-acetyltransferase [Paenibacillus sp. SC116]